MKFKGLYAFLALISLLLGCESNSKLEKEISKITVQPSFERFDQQFPRLNDDKLKALKTSYPFLFSTKYDDAFWIKKSNDSLEIRLANEVNKTFNQTEVWKTDVINLFKHIKYFYPNFKSPRVISLVSGVDYRNKTIVTDSIVLLALDNYFKIKPYTKWFGKPNISKSGFLPLLNGLGACYYKESQKNIALHTDICSPLATNPTWSGLNEKQKNILFKSGYELWKRLVIELKPDLILMSLKKDYLRLLPIEFVKQLKSKKSKQSTNRKQLEYTLDHYKLSFGEFQTNLIWGSAQNTPFQPFPNKIDLGKNILNYLNS